jgi:hypothetical protein
LEEPFERSLRTPSGEYGKSDANKQPGQGHGVRHMQQTANDQGEREHQTAYVQRNHVGDEHPRSPVRHLSILRDQNP